MRQSAMRAGRLLLVLACPLPIANAAQFILLLHGSADSWQVQEAEKITINSKDRLRLGATGKTSLSANDYKSLQATPIARAGMLRRHAGGYLVHKEGGAWEAVVPDGVAFKGSRAYSGLWSSTEVAVFKDRNTKNGAAIRAGELFAVLQGGDRDQVVADFLADQANFRGVGEADANAAFEERMSLLVAVAPTVKGAAATKVQQLLLVDMESTDRKLGSGLALHSDLLAGLRIVAVSEKAFPADAQQKKARNALLTKKAWLDQRIAILKAFQAGELWDAFLDKYGEMDRFDNSFPELHKIRERAFRESAENHLAEAKRLYQIKQYLPALSELKLARRRNPSSKEITGLLETIRMEEARDYVLTRPPRPDRSTTAQYRQATRHLQFAENYMTDGKLAEADEELTAAEALDRGSPRTLLARARLLHASKEPMKAIAMLDSYDRSVRKEEEITEGETLRAKILYQVKTTRKALHDAAIAAEAAGDYTKALESAKAGLVLDPEDTEFLLTAGRSAAITRDVTLARKMLSEYLECSEMPGLDTRTRASVYDLLTLLKTTFPEPEGVPNWFSGYKAAAGVFYCPVSLTGNARVTEIKASRKQDTSYEWAGEVLSAIHTTVRQPGEQDFNIHFDYDKERKAVRRVSNQPFTDSAAALGAPRLTAAGPVGAGTGVYVVLRNHPQVDPLMVERITGKQVATLVSGNPYFHPFAWEGIFVFRAEYDDQGRVSIARQILTAEQKGQPARVLEFRWEGPLLMEVTERGAEGYHRAMQYSGSKITGEVITYRGKNSKIEYKYRGDRLMEANCDADPSLDSRSRQVLFR